MPFRASSAQGKNYQATWTPCFDSIFQTRIETGFTQAPWPPPQSKQAFLNFFPPQASFKTGPEPGFLTAATQRWVWATCLKLNQPFLLNHIFSFLPAKLGEDFRPLWYTPQCSFMANRAAQPALQRQLPHFQLTALGPHPTLRCNSRNNAL